MINDKIRRYIGSGAFLYNKKVAIGLWFGLSTISLLSVVAKGQINNFQVFRHVYFHTVDHLNLYLFYPAEYGDVNLYGPLFALVIAPFALLPAKLGTICWVLANVGFLFWAIQKLPIAEKWRNFIVIICSMEMMITSGWLQSNALICGCILLGFIYINRGQEAAALFFILLATFIKLYGIVGFAFFIFSKRPLRFILWTVLWSVIFFFAPLLISHRLDYLLQSYLDWKEGLTVKAAKNVRLDIQNFFQDISITGLIRRNIYPHISDGIIILLGCILMGSQFVYYKYFSNLQYRLYILASVLIFVVIFSSGSESPTYIIAFTGVSIWFILQPVSNWTRVFFIVAYIITSYSYSDLLTPWFRQHIAKPHSIKALPATITWFIILYQIHCKQFLRPDVRFLSTEIPNPDTR